MTNAPPPGSIHAEDLATARAIAAGDHVYFIRLAERYYALLHRLARSFVSSRALAEEIVQDTWLAVFEALPSFAGRSSLKTWIVRILANIARTRGSREGRMVPFSSFACDDPSEAVDPSRFREGGRWASPPRRWDDDTPEKLLADAQVRRLVEQAIDDLPPGQRAVITLRDLGDWTSGEVCEALGVSEGNQRVLLHRARSRVRAAIERKLDGK